jgi:3-methyladenine DNA glycosylase AlkD
MTVAAMLAELESLGKEQTRKTYRRHGAPEPMYGVSFADFGKLKRKIKTNHALALGLWESGNYDARTFALMIADPDAITKKQINAWLKDIVDYSLAAALGGFVAKTPYAMEFCEKWIESKDEWTASAGWVVLSRLTADEMIPDPWFEEQIDRIVNDIHGAKNYVRYEMNGALISIGVRSAWLMEAALDAARKIGTVEVDHGDTSCKTPDAAEYIRKTVERKKKA